MRVHIRERKRSGGRIVLFLDYCLHNRRKKVYPNITLEPGKAWQNKEKRRLAEKLRSKLELELLYGLHGEIPEHQKKVSLFKWGREYADRFTGSSQRLYHAALSSFAHHVDKPIQIGSVTPQMILSFYDDLKNTRGGSTPNQYIKTLKRIFDAAIAQGMLSKNPCDIKLSRIPARDSKERLTEKEIRILNKSKCSHPNIKRAFLFSTQTGLRYSDTRNLTWANVHGNQINLVQQKTGVRNIIPLNASAIKLLGKKGAGKVFNLPRIDTVNRILRKWVRDSRIAKDITYHCARHTFGTLLAGKNINQKYIADIMGHTSTKETDKYVQSDDSIKRKAVNKLPKF